MGIFSFILSCRAASRELHTMYQSGQVYPIMITRIAWLGAPFRGHGKLANVLEKQWTTN
jgi:hypothetical protein